MSSVVTRGMARGSGDALISGGLNERKLPSSTNFASCLFPGSYHILSPTYLVRFKYTDALPLGGSGTITILTPREVRWTAQIWHDGKSYLNPGFDHTKAVPDVVIVQEVSATAVFEIIGPDDLVPGYNTILATAELLDKLTGDPIDTKVGLYTLYSEFDTEPAFAAKPLSFTVVTAEPTVPIPPPDVLVEAQPVDEEVDPKTAVVKVKAKKFDPFVKG